MGGENKLEVFLGAAALVKDPTAVRAFRYNFLCH